MTYHKRQVLKNKEGVAKEFGFTSRAWSACQMSSSDSVATLHHVVCFVRSFRSDALLQAVYDHKSEEIGPGIYRFKAEIGGCLLGCS